MDSGLTQNQAQNASNMNIKELNERIENIASTVRMNEKRIGELEKLSALGSGSIGLKIHELESQNHN